MCKKLIYLISFVLVLSLAGNVHAATILWTNAAGDGLWSNPGNWEGFALPTSADEAKIAISPGPTVVNEGAVCGQLHMGPSANTHGTLTIDGGTLTHNGCNLANNNTATVRIDLKSGSITQTGGGYTPQFGSLTINMTAGTWTVGGNWRIGHPSGTGGFEAHLDGGVLELGSLSIGRENCPRSMDLTDGVLVLSDDKRDQFQEYIDEGWITAYGGTDFVSVDYDVTNPGKTTLKAAKVFMNVNPAHASNACAGATQLQWTLPEPQQPGGVVTCNVYFGTTQTPWNEQTVVDGQAVESVSVTTDLGVYYWAIDVFDSSSSTPDIAVFLSPVLKFDTTNQPPIVDAGDDVGTFPVDGERVVQLDADVDDECGGPGASTVEWTIITEPNELNPAQISDPSVVNPTVTVKELGTYVLQLEAGDGEFTVADTMAIVLYADACEHAQNQEGFEWLAGDIDRDCKVDLRDFANLAVTWLDENYTTE